MAKRDRILEEMWRIRGIKYGVQWVVGESVERLPRQFKCSLQVVKHEVLLGSTIYCLASQVPVYTTNL